MRVPGIVLVLVLSFGVVAAQYRIVDEAEYRTACGAAVPVPLRARAESYRMTLETKSSMEGRPSTDYASRSVTSYQDRNKWHRLRESNFGTTKNVREEITVDGKTYVREGNGEWSEFRPDTTSRFGDSVKTDTRYISVEYRLLPDETLKGQTVKVCEKYEVAAVKTAGSESEARRESTSRFWVTNEGLLKSENSYRNISEKGTATSWIKNEWETDPTIKVSIPAKFAQ